MAINFPASPTTNQSYTYNGRTWTYNGIGWQATGSTGLTVYTKTNFTSTAGQTSYSATYTVGFVDVYYNGSKLSTSEYTATSGTTVVLGTAAAAGDIVETIAWTISSSFNPSLGSASATSLAIGGATIGTNALAVTGTAAISGAVTLTTPLATSSGGTGTSVATPYFNARNSVAQNVTSGVFTKATFGTVVTDTNSNFATSRFTATLAGTYHFDNTTRVSTDTTLTAVETFFYKNGSAFQKIISQLNTAGGAVFSGSANITLAASDYVEVYIAVSGTGTLSISYGNDNNCTWFSGYWVRG